ncbi:MAG TPA: hypothetical protein VKT78_00185 [Fimbriimonadaceae bacterium]|nr:hypothetical protein [Fimbriimonadaceae bacterium]
MSKLIDWYLVELRLRLSHSLAPDRVDEIVREAETHLLESVRNRQEAAVSEEAAAEAAILAFGDPGKVARGFLKGKAQRMLGLNPVWWALLGALVAVCGWNFHWLTLWGYFDNFGDNWQNGLALTATALGMGVILIAAKSGLRSHRWPLTLFTVAAAGASVLLVSYWMILEPRDLYPGLAYAKGVSRLHLDRDAPKLERTAKRLVEYRSFLERGMGEYATSTSDAALSPELRDARLAATEFGVERFYPAAVGVRLDHGGAYVVPRDYGVFTEIDGRIDLLETMAFYSDAKQAWATTGPKDLDQLTRQQQSLQGLIGNVRAARAGRLFFFEPLLYEQTLYGTLILIPGFLLFDLIGARIGRPARRWPRRALA